MNLTPHAAIFCDVLLSTSFLINAITLLFALRLREFLGSWLTAPLSFAAFGLGGAALSIGLSSLNAVGDRDLIEAVLKLASASALLTAAFLVAMFVRRAMKHRRLFLTLSDAELIKREQRDLALANTELEKSVVRRSYELERANRQMRLALLGSAITLFRQDTELHYTWIFNEPSQARERDYIGKTDWDIFPADVAMTTAEVKNRAMATGEEQSAEVKVRLPGGIRWYLLRSQPDYDTEGNTIGTISCAFDITDQKQQQQRQQLLMREVTHRSKNLLAVLQGVVRQTARRTRNVDEFIARFSARLHSMARSHDLLVNDDWSGTSIVTLIRSQLDVLSDLEVDRVHMAGPDLLMTSVAVQNLGLAIHELATNAVKHGALTAPAGIVEISWLLLDQPGEAGTADGVGSEVHLIWREVGGPPVMPGVEGGFGRTLLERVVGQALGGNVTLDFAPTGVVCAMTLPAVRVIAHRELPELLKQPPAAAAGGS